MKSAASIFAMSAVFSCGVIHQHSTMALQPPARMPMHRRPQPQTFPPIQKSSTVKEPPQTKEESAETDNLSPFLREMVDEQRELQMNVGKALDVLRNDYPYFLRRAPDYSIYSTDISLTSPQTPIATSSLSSYQRAIAVSRTMLNLLYDPERSTVQNRMVYDSTRCQIRVSFQAELIPRNLLAPRAYVDGISVYSFDLGPMYVEGVRRIDGGKIVEHRIEKLLVNGMAAMQPPYWNVWEMVVGQHGGTLAGAGAWS
ncbi:hypothetical protein ACHAW6_002022 [Cyclotella cf. meneghiniana]